MSEGVSIHHDQAGHQFEAVIDGHRAYLAYMDRASRRSTSIAPSYRIRCADVASPRR